MKPDWLIVYGDLSTYSNLDGSPFDAPGRGVLGIVKADPDVGAIVISDCHYYCWREAGMSGRHVGWFGVGKTDVLAAGLTDYLTELGPRKVILGYTEANMTFDQFMKFATTFGLEKSAIHPIERFNLPTPDARRA